MSVEVVSVVVPVYNGERFLAECLDSLVAQDYPAVEIVVVDDGSTDGSAAIAERYDGVRVLRRAHVGLAATRNAGVRATTGSLIGFCDADDWWKPQKASAQVAYLEAHPEVDIALCRLETHFEPGVAHPAWLIPDQRYGDLDGVSPTSALFRPAVFEQLEYRTDMVPGSDTNLLIRARTAGFHIAVIDELLLVRRIHGDNMNDRVGPAYQAMFDTVREHLRNRR
jgi:glycosyltransferase involved in cell wall biosynthesis